MYSNQEFEHKPVSSSPFLSISAGQDSMFLSVDPQSKRKSFNDSKKSKAYKSQCVQTVMVLRTRL